MFSYWTDGKVEYMVTGEDRAKVIRTRIEELNK